MTDEIDTNRPLNIILDVRQAVAQAQTNYQAALHGVVDADKQQLRKKWHVQTFAYFREIARYASSENIKEMWHEPDADITPPSMIDDDDPDYWALDDLRSLQFKQMTVEKEVYDNINKKMKIEKQAEMVVLRTETLLAITAKLDKCVSSLGFDAEPSTELSKYGFGESE